MRYVVSVDKSAELLRQAIPLMSRQATALHPVSYAVWYEYVALSNPGLRKAVDESLAKHGRLDEAKTYALHRKHIAEVDPATAEQIADGFERVLSGMSHSATAAGTQAERYAEVLGSLKAGLAGAAEAPVNEVLRQTADMVQAVANLQAQLKESRKEILDLRSEVHRARHESLVDALTGLANRRRFDQELATLLLDADALPNSADRPCLIMTDIDHFKRINDTYGHAFGDKVLKAVAQALSSVVADAGIVARIGGEEFAILLPAAPVAQAEELAERVRFTIATSRIRRSSGEELESITVSLGVTAALPQQAPLDLLARADAALYMSKQGGRDRVTAV
ncbi:GGDEF domain-containing protein [Roseateles saccharophilus]|uniref:diguanylate cyclase n=1 Tax=Roseateles saccharophilus TaxID=304 RepID=A0A4R3U938_ROSSA|nr:GGDEF domain-containing protein [Roseateles saccharophilus]MDG0835858.1 GGDEF domain-containing protein [Roseateles saccharophilus]TCU83065.1 diguanylate cyclase [Roseateles saccharophilus]